MRRILAIAMALLMLLGMAESAMPALAAHTHVFKWRVLSQPTCEEKGIMSGLCSCGRTGTKYIDPLGHDWSEWKVDREASSCTEWDGIAARTCSRCYSREEDEIKGDHRYGDWTIKREPTCTEKGQKVRKCKNCGEEQWASIPALGHEWSEWTIIQEAVGMQIGIRERVCARCGEVEREEFYPDGTLKKGDKGDAVEELQEALNDSGYNCGAVDGDFGRNTENALKRWQEANGYEPDGIAWPVQIDKIQGKGNYKTAIDLVVLTDTSAMSGKMGDVITIELGVTNTGETYLTLNQMEMNNGAGEFQEGDKWHDWSEGYWFSPGAYMTTQYDITVTQDDIYAGEIVRQLGQYARPYYNKNGDVIREGIPEDGAHIDPEVFYIDRVTVRIPLSADADRGDAVLEKTIANVPANGEFYVEGETIEYMLFFHNLRQHELHDIEVTDPLKGSNEDSVLTIEPVVGELGQLRMTFSYTVTKEDVEAGSVTNTASAMWWNPELEEQHFCYSNTLVTPVGVDQDPIVLTKTVAGAPENGEYYVWGEAVLFEITVENVSDETLYGVTVYDPLCDNDQIKTYESMEPGFSETLEVWYLVTHEDAMAQVIENTAYVVDPNATDLSDFIYSNTVTVDCGIRFVNVSQNQYGVGGFEVSKVVTTTPANGKYYQAGEEIGFGVTMTNVSQQTVYGVTFNDELASGGEVVYDMIEPGMSQSLYFNYTVTELDVAVGEVVNIAYVTGRDEQGRELVTASNAVSVPCSDEILSYGLSIVKEETSTPANGSYYTEGETISYLITYTNDGERDLGETIIYDTLNAGGADIASAEMLTVGESRTCTFNYVVTAADVEKGYVVNAAFAQYFDASGVLNTVVSNIVTSDTDGEEDEIFDGYIDWEKLEGEDRCYIAAVYRDDDTIEHEMHFCERHQATYDVIYAMAQSAADDASRQVVWDVARAMWQNEVDTMYSELIDAADGPAKIALINDRVTYLSMVGNTQYAMQALGTQQPTDIAQVVTQLWMTKCAELCGLNAPADGIFDISRSEGENTAAENCSKTATDSEESRLVSDGYCADHTKTYDMTEVHLLSHDTLESWQTVRAMWEVELHTAYNNICSESGEEGAACMAEYASFMNWIAAQEELLNMLYPNDPMFVAEKITTYLMQRTQFICAR